jgi:cyclic pyranopterin phosphate synthase
MKLGGSAVVEITQFGKECHSRCEIFEQVGDCIMPREGIFAKVIKPGCINVGDTIEVLDD